MLATHLGRNTGYGDINPPTVNILNDWAIKPGRDYCWRTDWVFNTPLCFGESKSTEALLREQPQQPNLEKKDTNQTRSVNKCLTCWKPCHPWESTEKFFEYPFIIVNVHFVWNKNLWKNLFLKQWYFYQVKHAKHLLNWNKQECK
jgi:hypothetical protein